MAHENPAPDPSPEAAPPGGVAAIPAATPDPAAPAQRLFEWVWRRRALAAVRTRVRPLTAARQERLDRAQAAAGLADRQLDPVDPPRPGDGPWLAVSLYREAAHWALLASDEALAADTLAQAWDASDPALLASAAGADPAELRAALVERSTPRTAALPRDAVDADARRARAFVHALIGQVLGPFRDERRVLAQRCLRTLLATALVVGLLGGVVQAVRYRNRNLADGRPWRASSSLAACNPVRHLCAGVSTAIFFSTLEEESPWFELDMGPAMSFSSVEVTNRSDCCPERAVPLVVEVSNDRRTWTEVARRDQVFSTWKASFAPQTAQYLRLRVLRRSFLHLEGVVVRGPGRVAGRKQ